MTESTSAIISQLAEIQEDLLKLQNDYDGSNLRSDYVKSALRKLALDISRDVEIATQSLGTKRNEWKIKVKTEEGIIVITNLSPSSSLAYLINSIRDAVSPLIRINSLSILRTGMIITDLDEDVSLAVKGLQNLDILDVHSDPLQNHSVILQRLNLHEIYPNSPLELVFLGLHCCLLDLSFVVLITDENIVPGFAPPLKELPRDRLLPSNYSKNSTAFSLTYKHKAKFGKLFSFTVLGLGEAACVASFSMKNGASNVTQIEYSDVIIFGAPMFDIHETVLRGSALSIASGFIPEPADTDIMSSHQDQALKTSQDESPTRNLSNIPYRPSVGDNDLFPFSPLVGRNPNGGGSLVGPGHPLFGRTPMYDPHNPDHFLQPRFDPLFPAVGSNPLFGPPNTGIPRPGYGRGGTGRGRNPFPGEPDDDHLRPPSLNPEHDFYS